MGFKQLELRKDEQLLMTGAANKWQTVGSKGGHLFLTDQRIVFKAHGLNFGSKMDEYELSEIQTQGNTVDIKTTTNLISFNITFSTKSGEKLSFVVTRKDKNEWIQKIIEAVTSFTRANISLPENISQEEKDKITSQINVAQCGGCGAFVIITSKTAVKCDYCGRPTVG